VIADAMDSLTELDEHLVCGDGAMGTLLLARGVPVDHCMEELCLSEPDRILAVSGRRDRRR
jgi:methionine synthase I (cobalamin-dependent)